MKTGITLRGIKIEGVEINEIKIEQEYTVTEAIYLAKFVKKFMVDLIEEAPAIAQKMINTYEKIQEMDKAQEVKEELRKVNETEASIHKMFSAIKESIKA